MWPKAEQTLFDFASHVTAAGRRHEECHPPSEFGDSSGLLRRFPSPILFSITFAELGNILKVRAHDTLVLLHAML